MLCFKWQMWTWSLSNSQSNMLICWFFIPVALIRLNLNRQEEYQEYQEYQHKKVNTSFQPGICCGMLPKKFLQIKSNVKTSNNLQVSNSKNKKEVARNCPCLTISTPSHKFWIYWSESKSKDNSNSKVNSVFKRLPL